MSLTALSANTISELLTFAKSSKTVVVSSCVSPITTGILGFIMPPFSKAIASRVSPKNCV